VIAAWVIAVPSGAPLRQRPECSIAGRG
jgi:hypothetical protein